MTRRTPPEAAPPAPVPTRSPRTPGTLVLAGGLAMTVLFVPFTLTHGPTSANAEGRLLGLDMHVWGLMLGVVPNVLIGLGFWRLRGRLAGPLLLPWVACTTICLVMWASALLDLLFRALGPPLGLLVLAPAVVAAAVTMRPSDPPGQRARLVLGGLGVLLVIAMILVFIPVENSDASGGFRIFGIAAYALPGLFWAAVGAVFRVAAD